jgi:hypothetical protein
VVIHIYTHNYIKMEITVLYLKISRHQLSISWLQISVYWLRLRVASKLNLPPSNLQLMPWNFQIQCNYPLILVFANDIKKYTPIGFFETRWPIQIILYLLLILWSTSSVLIMKINLKQWRSSLQQISTKWTRTSHFKSLNAIMWQS